MTIETKGPKTIENNRNICAEPKGIHTDLGIPKAMLEGIRDIGYSSTATAVAALVDNSIEAGSKNFSVEFKLSKDGKKPDAIAFIDDGRGLSPASLGKALLLGGTHVDGGRKGFGRFGFGLTISSLSQARKVCVYSKITNSQWNVVELDLDFDNEGFKRNISSLPKISDLPIWIKDAIFKQFGFDELSQGTVIVLEKLDRLTWATASGLTGNLLEFLGLTYRNYLSDTHITVNGKSVEPIDPLFAMPGARFYNLDDDRAQVLEPMTIPIKVKNGDARSNLYIRLSILPTSFGLIDKNNPEQVGNSNPRMHIMKENQGIVVCRMGRQIGIIKEPNKIWKNVTSFDSFISLYWKVEIDFNAELDEEFNLTLVKDHINPTQRIWEILANNGLERAIMEMNQKVRLALSKGAETPISSTITSEQIMNNVILFPNKKSHKIATSNSKISDPCNMNGDNQMSQRSYKIEFDDVPGGVFVRSEKLDTKITMFVNRQHAFYNVFYSQIEKSETKSAVEILLFVLSTPNIEINNDDTRKLEYDQEIKRWSKELETTFRIFEKIKNKGNV